MALKRSAPALLAFLMILSGALPLLAGQGMRQLQLPAGNGSLWIWNLGDQPAQVSLKSARPLSIAAGAFREVPAPRAGWASFRAGSQLVFVSASRDLDPSAFEFDLRATARPDETEPGLVRLTRPAWSQDLLVQAAGRSPAGPGGTLRAAPEVGEDGRARFAVGLLGEGSAAVLALRDVHGEAIRSFAVASTVPVRLRADLGSAGTISDAHAEVAVVRGRAVTSSAGSIQPKSTQGSCNPSSNLIFSGSYTYSCTGGQPSVCGELDIVRNGVSQSTPGWFCTDGSGNGTMGPWNWSDKASDETGDPIHITWPNGNVSNDSYIIVDKNPAYTYVGPSMPTNSVPTSYYGHTTDATWGTGFDFGYVCFSTFQDLTTGKYWNGSTYSATYAEITCSSVTQSGRWYADWTTSFPSVGSHTSGHTYQWQTCMTDYLHGYCTGAGPGYNNPPQFTP